MTITALATEAVDYLNRIESLQENKRNANDLEATHRELQKVKELTRGIHSLLQLYHNRLPIQDIPQIDLQKVLSEIQKHQTNFTEGQQRRQVKELQDIASQLNRIKTKVQARWREQTERQLKPYSDLHNTVRSIPEIRSQEATLNGLLNELRHAISVMPQSQQELKSFDHSFEQYRQRLSTMEHLHPDVQAFLQKANNYTATMADVTDEVLCWCRQGNNAQVFRVSFAS